MKSEISLLVTYNVTSTFVIMCMIYLLLIAIDRNQFDSVDKENDLRYVWPFL